jgi:hypothetical protein
MSLLVFPEKSGTGDDDEECNEGISS